MARTLTTHHSALTTHQPPLTNSSRGIAMLLVLGVLAVTLALVYSVSRSSVTASKQSANESAGLRAHSGAQSAAAVALDNFSANPNWMPDANPMSSTLSTGDPYTVDVQLANNGSGRTIAAIAQVLDPHDSHTLANQLLTINLTKQLRDNHPMSAIAAFATAISSTDGVPVYVAAGTTIRGDARSRGPIQFQVGFVLQGQTYVMGDIARDGTDWDKYLTYRAAWGANYPATNLASYGEVDSTGWLALSNVTLGPSTANPMGVYYHSGNVVLDDNFTLNGTLVLKGDLAVIGTGVKIFALQQALDPATSTTYKTSFPAVVANGSIEFDYTADVVRIWGLVLAGKDVYRVNGLTDSSYPINVQGHGKGKGKGLLMKIMDPHNHTLTIAAIPDPFGTSDGPAIYIKGAIMATFHSLRNLPGLPFALVFDAAATDTTDAPGFFTWKVSDWKESN